MNKIIKLSKEDKEKFRIESGKLTTIELLQATRELDIFKERFNNADYVWMTRVLGNKLYYKLKNAIKNLHFD